MSKLLLLLKKLGWPQVSKIRRISGTDFVHLLGLVEKLLSRAHLTCQIGLPDIPDAKKTGTPGRWSRTHLAVQHHPYPPFFPIEPSSSRLACAIISRGTPTAC